MTIHPVRGLLLQWRREDEPKSARNEIVIALAVLSIVSGGGGLLVPDLRPRSVQQLVPLWATLAWCFCLLIGGGALLAAIIVRDRITAWYVERPSMLMLGGGAMVYAACLAAVLFKGQFVAFVAFVTYVTYGGACLVRLRRIHRYLRALARASEAARA